MARPTGHSGPNGDKKIIMGEGSTSTYNGTRGKCHAMRYPSPSEELHGTIAKIVPFLLTAESAGKKPGVARDDTKWYLCALTLHCLRKPASANRPPVGNSALTGTQPGHHAV